MISHYVKRFLIISLAIFIDKVTTAQTALIKDPNGYCNIRQSASIQSKVLDTLSNDRIIFVFEEHAEGNWLPVDYKKGNETISGYVHKSRIAFLTSLSTFKQVTLNDSILKLQLDSFLLSMAKTSFNRKGRQLNFDKQQGYQTFMKYIDNKFPWGTDGNIPQKEYKFIQFKTRSTTLNFPTNWFKDLFEPNLDMTNVYLDKTTGKFYIEAFNSDGAGGYLVIWTIKNRQIIGRETFIPF